MGYHKYEDKQANKRLRFNDLDYISTKVQLKGNDTTTSCYLFRAVERRCR